MFVRTERLLLRPGWIEDAPALASAIGDEAVVRNLARAPWPYRPVDAEAFLAREAEPALPDFLMFARTHAAPRLVGGIGLCRGEDAGNDVELGYWIARRFWGLGFATEAGRAVVALAHQTLRLKRLASAHFRDNPGSGRVLRKLGFRPTGATVLRHSKARGSDVATQLFAREASDAMPQDDVRPLAA